MAAKIKPKKFFVITLILFGFMVPKACALKLTLSDEGLMGLSEYSKYNPTLKSTVLEKRDVDGPGVEFDIYFPGNKSPNHSVYYVFSQEKLKEVFQGIDLASCDAFELKFTLISVEGNDSPDSGGGLVVGALKNGAYRPEVISLSKNHPKTAVSTTGMNGGSLSRVGFTAHFLTPKGWSPNGTTLTLLIQSASKDDICAPLAKQDDSVKPESKTIYVDPTASGAGDGSSWTDAFKYLQDGLAEGSEGDEVWVAKGIYRPDQGKNKKKGDKTLSFVLNKGIDVYGGFPSGGGVWEDINAQVNTTTLSGDLQCNDASDIVLKKLLSDVTRKDNSYRVVSASGTDFDTALDGFTITGGNAKGASRSSYNKGGGVYCKSGSLSLSNCVLKANAGLSGGAIYNLNGSPLLTNCIFFQNYAGDSGGAIYSSKGSPILYNCVLGSNYAKEKGGGMYNEYSSPIKINCTFSGNVAYAGGGIYCHKSKPIITNCILWDNSSRYGKVEPSQIYAVEASIDHSCIQGLTEELKGKGNINLDPKFVNTAENDFNLKADSPCIDAGINDSLPPEINTDVDGTLRLKDGNNDGVANIDIGAHEF